MATPPATGRVDRWIVALHLASLVLAGLYLLRLSRGQWFSLDEWDFLVRRGLTGAERGLFEPHNEHWSTVPILVYRALFSFAGVRSYLPYFATLVVVHLSVAHALYRVGRRCGLDAAIAAALVVPFALIGPGAENTLWAFQIGFVGSVALGLAQVLVLTGGATIDRRQLLGAWALGVLSLACSGIGVTMVAAAALVVLLRDGWRKAALVTSVPAAAYLVWLAAVGRHGLGTHPVTVDNLFLLPEYVWTGVSTAYQSFLGFPGSGPAVVLAVVAALVTSRRTAGSLAAPAIGLAAGVLALFAINAVGRAGFGNDQAMAGRYIYITVALSLPAFGLLLQWTRSVVDARVLTIALCGLLLLHNVGVLRRNADSDSTRELPSRAQILAAARLVRSDARLLNPLPEPHQAPDLDVDDLRRLARDGQLPETIGHDETAALDATAALQVAVDNHARFPAESARLITVADIRLEPAPDGCFKVTPTGPRPDLLLETLTEAVVRLTPDGDAILGVFVRGTERIGHERQFHVRGGVTSFLHMAAPMAVTVRMPSSVATICDVVRV